MNINKGYIHWAIYEITFAKEKNPAGLAIYDAEKDIFVFGTITVKAGSLSSIKLKAIPYSAN